MKKFSVSFGNPTIQDVIEIVGHFVLIFCTDNSVRRFLKKKVKQVCRRLKQNMVFDVQFSWNREENV